MLFVPPRIAIAAGLPFRWARLGIALGLGKVSKLRRHGWWPFLTTLGIVMAILIGGPLLLHLGESLLKRLGVNNVPAAPTVDEWVSFTNVVLLTLAVYFGRWLLRARDRVVVESFVDFTKEEATAVSGLSTLLVTELGRLRGLYYQIDDLSIPTAVGVERHGGFGRGKEAGDFLTVSADDRTDVLQSVVSSDASLQLGPAKIPIGPIFNFLGRLARGPRVVGSVHLTEAGGGPTLTAQLVDKELTGTWRVDQKREPESEAERKAFLDSMVCMLACQIFTQVSLKGSIRPEAVEPFNEYLRLYRASQRTPGDRASFLKQAQTKLLEAVAADERFDLAYYNLGVIYTQLAHAESMAEEQSDDATSRARFDRSELQAARLQAARFAFVRAIAKNPDRWEAYYAQAVTIFSQVPEVEINETLEPSEPRAKDLGKVIELCEQVLAVSADQGAGLAAVFDLRGMAQARLDEFPPAMASHRRAMHHAWIEYCRARRSDAARPTGQPGLAEHARANATAALHDLALDYERRAALARKRRRERQGAGRELPQSPREWLDRSTSQGLFKWAARRAGEGSVVSASCRFERGRALEHAGRFRKAAGQLGEAGRINPLSPEYQAHRAKAFAKEARRLRASWRPLMADRRERKAGDWEGRAHAGAQRAIDLLAQPFSLAVVPFTPTALKLQCAGTLEALERAIGILDEMQKKSGRPAATEGADFDAERRWIEGIEGLQAQIYAESTESIPGTGRVRKPKDPAEGAANLKGRLEALDERHDGNDDLDERRDGLDAWECDQIELAMGRLYADARQWDEARKTFTRLVNRITARTEAKRLVEFSAYAHKARALRESGRYLPRNEQIVRYVEALEAAAEGVRRDPLNVEARREAGRAHFALGQYSDALDSWKHALWLSPSDPYLHYEMAMCHRRLAQDQAEPDERKRQVKCAKDHFDKARALFDGEDLDGEAWTRFWRGKIALEEGEPAEALGYLQGAEHGSAEAAAALLVGEAHLALDQRPAADHAFSRCEEATKLMKAGSKEEGSGEEEPGLRDRPTIDWLWGDELPWEAVDARIKRGKAEAIYLAPGDWQSPKQTKKAKRLLKEAEESLGKLQGVEAHDAAMPRVLDAYSLLLRASGDIEKALDCIRERLRYEKTADALRVEAELLDLRAKWGASLPEEILFALAADHTWDAIPGNGRPKRPGATPRRS
jgi:tetratricopeptide (TPR) repeat protein